MRKDRGPVFPRNPPEWDFDDLSAEKLETRHLNQGSLSQRLF